MKKRPLATLFTRITAARAPPAAARSRSTVSVSCQPMQPSVTARAVNQRLALSELWLPSAGGFRSLPEIIAFSRRQFARKQWRSRPSVLNCLLLLAWLKVDHTCAGNPAQGERLPHAPRCSLGRRWNNVAVTLPLVLTSRWPHLVTDRKQCGAPAALMASSHLDSAQTGAVLIPTGHERPEPVHGAPAIPWCV